MNLLEKFDGWQVPNPDDWSQWIPATSLAMLHAALFPSVTDEQQSILPQAKYTGVVNADDYIDINYTISGLGALWNPYDNYFMILALQEGNANNAPTDEFGVAVGNVVKHLKAVDGNWNVHASQADDTISDGLGFRIGLVSSIGGDMRPLFTYGPFAFTQYNVAPGEGAPITLDPTTNLRMRNATAQNGLIVNAPLGIESCQSGMCVSATLPSPPPPPMENAPLPK